jgi:transcriptional regulator with XRE-family HTH domain
MSQEELAASLQLAGLNLSQKAISRIETGERVLPDFELVYFSKVLGTSPEDLLGTGIE